MSEPARPPLPPVRWQEVKAIVAAALERPPAERAAHVAQACAIDEELRREVESLLRAHEAAGAFLERPAIEDAGHAPLADADDEDAALAARLAAALADRYAIERELGGGGMARVYVATERALGRRVVVKLLSSSTAAGLSVSRFRREIALAARLQHANIVPLLAAGEADGLPYYTMPYVEGLSLRARLQRGDAIGVGEVVSILHDVSRALAYAHAHGVVHRDIKPDNVLVAGGSAVVTDFGIAKALSTARTTSAEHARDDRETLTQHGTTLGTPAYMAPEQLAGEAAVDERADVYALGCTAYELLTGHPPFHGYATRQLLAAHLTERPAPVADARPDVPSALAALVTRCLEKDPARRPSAAELAQALDAGIAVDAGPRRDADRPRTRLAFAAAALALAAAGGLFTSVRDRTRGAGIRLRTIAVRPLTHLGGDTADAYFVTGLADELTNALAKIDGLRVTPPGAGSAASGAGARELARMLGVETLLDGSVQRAGDRLRVRVRLVSGDDGHVLWSHEYDDRVADLLAVQRDVADSVAASLRVTLSGTTQARVARASGTRDADAYLLYLQGRHAAARYTEADLRRGIALYHQAIGRDSGFARAWAGVADAWVSLSGDFVPAPEALPAARQAAHRALAIDSSLTEAHVALGNVLLASWDAAGAARAFARAVSLEPHAAAAHYYAASALLAQGRLDEALAHADTARRLEPAQAAYLTAVALVQLRAGQLDSAVATARRAQALDSAFTYAATVLGDALRLRGAAREALDAYASRGPAQTAYDLVGPALARVALGQPDEARRTVREIVALGTRQHVPADAVAMVHAHLGARDSAFAWLERALASRTAALIALPVDPDWGPLRGDPRFAALVRRVVPR
ncbi:protein kinase domain-containing protein [Roseisolibacter agri]|uniref:non-specific serine/threonine protein kinase n=1 Tax=Roseisolibacter agri TaxID=2014610 RepID=A0AA37Q1K2_9BACT|nr:protein kinase [Roseisolibacter agri]GLC24905.1 serine/threonine protein kinase [Roseisolibacter agri]